MGRIAIEALDGSGGFAAYLAEPEGAPKGAIVVIQEIFGVNEGIRRKCDHWASLGYVALAPDLFWRLEPAVELDPDVPEEFDSALALMNRLDQDKAIADIEAAIRDGALAGWPRAARSAASAIAWAAGSPSWPRRAPISTPRSAITASASRG